MNIKEYIRWLGKIIRKPDSFEAIKRISIFVDLNSFQLHELNNYLHTRHYKAGEVIFEQGYPLDAIFFIIAGEVRVSGKLSGSDPITLRENDFIGIIDMFHEGTRSSTAMAVTEVNALAISRSDLTNLIARDKDMGLKILGAICRYLSSLNFSKSV